MLVTDRGVYEYFMNTKAKNKNKITVNDKTISDSNSEGEILYIYIYKWSSNNRWYMKQLSAKYIWT